MRNPLELLEELAAHFRPALAADVEVEIDVARIGSFKDMKGQVVQITRDVLHELANGLDLKTFRPKIKKGHVKSGPTDEPALGEVVGLRVDGDSLMAKLAMSKDLAEEVRNRKFTERSIEYDDRPGKRKFLGLALLGARDPAIAGLSPLVLQASEVEAGHVVMLSEADPVAPPPAAPTATEAAPPLDGSATLKENTKTETTTRSETTKESPMAEKDEKALQDATRERDEAVTRLAAYAAGDVDRFLASDVAIKKIPLGLLKNQGLRNFLVSLAALEATGGSRVVKFAAPTADGKGETEVEISLYAAAQKVFLAFPDKLTKDETTMLASDEKAGRANDREAELPAVPVFLSRDTESDDLNLRIVDLQNSEKKAGREISYEAAMKLVASGN